MAHILNVQEDTTINLTDYVFKLEKPAENSFKLKLLEGAVKVATCEMGHISPAKYELSTDLMTIGVRGTLFGAKSKTVNTTEKSKVGLHGDEF